MKREKFFQIFQKGFSLFSLFFAVILMMSFMPCTPSEEPLVSIDTPEEGVVTNQCQSLRISFPSGQVPYLFAQMNYLDITQLLRGIDGGEITTEGAMIPADVLCDYHGEGNNLIQITAFTNTKTEMADRRFVFDTVAPRIEVTSIDDLDPETIRIVGNLVDVAGGQSLTINEISAPLEAGHFEVELPASDYLSFHATDIFGAVTNYTVAREGTIVSDAVGLRLNHGGFDDIAAYLTETMMADLSALCPNLTQMNPIMSGEFSQGPTTITYEVNITEATCGNPYILLYPLTDPARNALVVGISIPDLRMTLEVSGTISAPNGNQDYSGNVYISADLAEILDTIDLAVQEDQIVAVAQEVTVEITNLTVTTEGLPEMMEEFFTAENLETILEEALAAVITEVLEATVDQLLAFFNYESEMRNDTYDFTLHISLLPQSLVFSNGSMTYFTKGSMTSDAANPDVPFFPGSFYTQDSAPNFDVVHPEDITEYDLAMTISDDFLNEFLYILYKAGIFNEEMTIDIPDDPTVQLLLAILGLPVTDQLILGMESLSPPSMRFDQFDANNAAALNWTDLVVHLSSVPAENGKNPQVQQAEDEEIVGLVINGTIPVTIEVTDHNTIIFQLSEETFLSIDSSPEAANAVPTTTLENFLNATIAEVIAAINASLPEIPLPTSESGIQYTLLEINTNLDGMGGFLTVFANLGETL